MKKVSKIVSTSGEGAGFSVTFPDGIDGEPKIEFTGLNLGGDCDDGAAVCALEACGNYLFAYAESIHARSNNAN